MADKMDDLDAVRTIVTKLQPFKADERERIIRWTLEKLGMALPAANQVATDGPAISTPAAHPAAPIPTPPAALARTGTQADIKSFVTEKNPKSDTHFAATVAYFHQFIAPPTERKESITKQDLVTACRQVPRRQPKRVEQMLVNTYQAGFFDRGEAGRYKLNAVGENLVAMTLPGDGTGTKKRAAKAKRGAVRKKTKGSRAKR